MRRLNDRDLAERGAVLVTATATYELYEFPDRASGGWRNFYLRSVEAPVNRRMKRAWWIGHNGERLNRGKDVQALRESDPATFLWLVEVLGRECTHGKTQAA